MAAGLCMAHRGCGGRGRFSAIRTIGRCGRQRTYLSSDSAAVAGELPLALAQWDGCRLGRVIGYSPGTAVTDHDLTSSTSPTLLTFITIGTAIASMASGRFMLATAVTTCALQQPTEVYK